MLPKFLNMASLSTPVALMAGALLVSGCAGFPGVQDNAATTAQAIPLPQDAYDGTPVQTMTREDAARLAQEADRVLSAGRLTDAGAAYIRIVTVFPDDARAWFRLGTIYLRTGQNGAAQMACERALRFEPGMAKAQANLALAHLRQFRAAAALATASAEVPEVNRKALASLVRDVDHAIGPAAPAFAAASAGVAQ